MSETSAPTVLTFDMIREQIRLLDAEWANKTPLLIEERLMRLEQMMHLMVWAVGRIAQAPVHYPDSKEEELTT